MRTRTPPRRVGFTLPELLVVLVILAVLAAILITAFIRVREKGRRTVCQSNLKQIALAMQQYVADSDGTFPVQTYVVHKGTPEADYVTWDECILPYVKNREIFWCPTSQRSRENHSTSYGYNSSELTSLVVNPRGMWFNEFHGKHEARLPSTLVIAYDQSWFEMTTPRKYFDVGLHSNGMNLSFFDGHVKWYSLPQLDELAGGKGTF